MLNKKKVMESLYEIFELSRDLETWQQEKEALNNLDELAKSFGVFNEFMEYLDNQADIEEE